MNPVSKSPLISRRDVLARSSRSACFVVFSSALRNSFAFQVSETATGKKGKAFGEGRKKHQDSKSGATVWQLTDTPGKWTEVLYLRNRAPTGDSCYLIYVPNRASRDRLPPALSGQHCGIQGIEL